MGRRVIGWLAWLSGASARIEELENEIEFLREATRNLSRGYSRVEETTVRMFQAEDEQRRLRVQITQAALDSADESISQLLLGLLTGHILHPAKRVTEEE